MTEHRSLARAALDALSGVPLFVSTPFRRKEHLRWGASDAEVAGAMPGDDLVPKASFDATRAITIEQGERDHCVAVFTLLLLELGDFPMMRRMLTGIKERAERLRHPGGARVP